MRAVLDTNVIISGLLWRGAPHRCLLAADAGLYEFVLADEIIDELREKLIEKFENTVEEADQSVAGLARVAKIVELSGTSGWVPADPDDDKFVDAAIVAGANVIVSGDRHLRELGTVEGVRVLSPREFLDVLAAEE
jgi:putative PIN family toxin of toxin-antitoxin system